MKAKLVIAVFLALFAATVPVFAQGNGNGGGGGNSSQTEDTDTSEDDGGSGNGGNGNGNNGNGNGNGNASPKENSNGNNNAGGGGNGAGAGNAPSRSNDVTVVPEEDLLAIVKAGQAVSLASLLPNVQERTGGEIIDAQLVRTARSLIYVVKVLTPDGHVGIEYYNARSGIYIEAR